MRAVDIGTGLLDEARETWFESWSFTILWQLGIEVPAAQVAVYDARGRFVGRVDGLWREGGTVVEADGAGKYLGEFDTDGPSGLAAARAVVAEKVREDRLRNCGLEVVRYDVPEMRWRPQDVAARVHDARERGDLGRFTGRLVPSPWSACRSSTPCRARGCPGCSETTDAGPLRPSIGCRGQQAGGQAGSESAGRGRGSGGTGRSGEGAGEGEAEGEQDGVDELEATRAGEHGDQGPAPGPAGHGLQQRPGEPERRQRQQGRDVGEGGDTTATAATTSSAA